MPPKTPAAPKAAGKARATTKPKPAAKPKPVQYSEEVVQRVCDEIAIGRSVKAISREPWAPSQDAWYSWMWRHEGVAEKYARAKEAAQHAMAAQMFEVIEEAKGDPKLSDWARQKVDAIKWQAAKLAPKTFGDKQTIDLNVADADKDDKELAHELRSVAERLGVSADAMLAGLVTPDRGE